MSERARQFLSFAALRGYYDMVRQGAAVLEPKRSLSDEQCAKLDETVAKIKRGMLVSVNFYENFSYVSLDGRVEDLSPEFRKIRVGKKSIDFDDLYELKILGNFEDSDSQIEELEEE